MNQDSQEQSSRLTSSRLPTMEAIFNCISHEELPALRSDIRQTAVRIFDNWGTLQSIVTRHEATIQKRWTNKSKVKRRELLLTIWPNMTKDHRPDLALEEKWYRKMNSTGHANKLLQGSPKQRELYEGSQREALLMPHINLHDLTKTEPLLLMINGRARQTPHAFSKRDLQLSTIKMWMTERRWLKGYIMDFDRRQSVPEEYGELREGDVNFFPSATGADPRIAGGTISPGDGLWVLEIQDRTYKFLLDAVQRILHDIPIGDLTGPKYPVQPEPSLPSANSREDGVVSLASTNLEAIYSSPGQMDLHRLQLLVTAKATEEEDKLWALREDPGRFSEGLEDYLAHRPQYVPDLLGKQHHTTTIDGCRAVWGSDTTSLEDVLSVTYLMSQFACVEIWSSLLGDITSLVELKKQHFGSGNVETCDPLPEPFAVALYNLEATLCTFIDKSLFILSRAVYSSPPLRPYIARASPDDLGSFVFSSRKRPPQHIGEIMAILDRLFDENYTVLLGHISGTQSLMERYDMFINTVPDAHQAVSAYVAQEISTLALLSECLRQIHLFEPWTSTSHERVGTPHFEANLKAHFTEKQCEIMPIQKFKGSARVRSMATAVGKSSYPVHKKRTPANVDAMQKAETLLDQMWDALLEDMEQHDALTKHSKNVLFFQGRQLQRTPDWVQPVGPTKKIVPQGAALEIVRHSFGGLKFDDDSKVLDSSREKTKIKTRGKAAPQTSASTSIEMTEPEDQSPAHTIQVDRRASKVFSTLFHQPSTTSKPGEVPWTEFLHAMRSAGFEMEKLYGSVWQFTPRDDNDGRVGAGMRSILFHEPHPHSKIPFWDARRHGRRLTRAYGWSGETFVVK